MPKSKIPKLSDAEQVDAFMQALVHPLKDVVALLRTEIKNANTSLKEHIKWNAPSYFTHLDLITFNLKSNNTILLILHNIACTKINSELLEGDYTDRRIIYFKDTEEVATAKNELVRIINEYVKLTEA